MFEDIRPWQESSRSDRALELSRYYLLRHSNTPDDPRVEPGPAVAGMAISFHPLSYRSVADLVQNPNARRIISQHAFRGNERVLDLGCGEGTLTATLIAPLVPRGSVVGIDKSSSMIEVATSSFPQVRFVEGDILNFGEVLASHDLTEKFDVIFSNFALHWMGNTLGHTTALELIRAHLAPGGVALLSFPSRDTYPDLLAAGSRVSRTPTWQSLFADRRDTSFLSGDEIQPIAQTVGLSGRVEDSSQWITFTSASELARFFATCIRSYMQFLPDPIAQQAFSTEVIKEYEQTISHLDDYPRLTPGLHLRQRLIDAFLT